MVSISKHRWPHCREKHLQTQESWKWLNISHWTYIFYSFHQLTLALKKSPILCFNRIRSRLSSGPSLIAIALNKVPLAYLRLSREIFCFDKRKLGKDYYLLWKMIMVTGAEEMSFFQAKYQHPAHRITHAEEIL